MEQEQGRHASSVTTNYDPKTDSTDIRKALPDEINFQVGQTTETIYDRLIADNGDDQYAVTVQRVPPAVLHARSRVRSPTAPCCVKSPYVDYLVPNFRRLHEPRRSARP